MNNYGVTKAQVRELIKLKKNTPCCFIKNETTFNCPAVIP